MPQIILCSLEIACLLKIIRTCHKKSCLGTSLVFWWVRLCTPNGGGTGSIPDQGTNISHAVWHGKEKKKSSLRTFADILIFFLYFFPRPCLFVCFFGYQ